MKAFFTICFVLVILCMACSDTPKLEQTPLSITDISEIGELITAEYYGEVIQSLETVVRSDIEYELQSDYFYLKQVFQDYARTSKNENKLIRKFRQNNITSDYRFKRLQKISDQSSHKFISDILAKMDWKLFSTRYKSSLDSYLSKREREDRGEIVYLGRGWVKAGFDLKRVNFVNSVSISSDTLLIRNLDPILLDADINPWLVPNLIKGFEIIKMKNNVSLNQIHTVKRNCKLRLKQEAIAAGIYEHALTAGAQSLEGLFGLMDLPGSGYISTVVIEPTKYFEFKIDILEDARIDSSEFRQVEALIAADTLTLDQEWFSSIELQRYYLATFIDELETETSGNYNYPQWNNLSKRVRSKL